MKYVVVLLVTILCVSVGNSNLHVPDDCLAKIQELEVESDALKAQVGELVNVIALKDAERSKMDRLIEQMRREYSEMDDELKKHAIEVMVWRVVAGFCTSVFLLYTLISAVVRGTSNVFRGMIDYIMARSGFIRLNGPQGTHDVPLVNLARTRSEALVSGVSTPDSGTLEANVEGSIYKPTKAFPKCQIELQYVDSTGRTIVAGQGFRLGDYFVTARHLISELEYHGYQDLFIIANGSRVVSHINQWAQSPDIDLAYLPWNQSLHQCLARSKAELLELKSMHARIPLKVYSLASFTEGYLQPHPYDSRVWYYGSTKKGFSGCPYMWENKVVAMHLGSHEYGYGVDCHLIKSFLPRHTLESDSSDTGLKMIQNTIEKFYSEGVIPDYYLTPGEIRIRIGDKYIVEDVDDMPDEFMDIVDYNEGKRTKPQRKGAKSWRNECDVQAQPEPEATEKEPVAESQPTVSSIVDQAVSAYIQAQEARTMVKIEDLRVRDTAERLAATIRRADQYDDQPSVVPDSPKNSKRPPVAEGSGKQDLAAAVLSQGKILNRLQSQISQLDKKISSTGQQSTRAPRSAASPNT